MAGVTASVRETLLFLGEMGAPGLRRSASVGPREVDQVQCRNCLAVLPVKAQEMLGVA